MGRIKLQIEYKTKWGQKVYVCGSPAQLGNNDESLAVEMQYSYPSKWILETDIEGTNSIEYYYLIKEQGIVTRKEWGDPHTLETEAGKTYEIYDIWQDTPKEKSLYTSGFSDSFFFHENKAKIKYYQKTILINAYCPYVKRDQSLILCGSPDALGNWNPDKAPNLIPVKYGQWQIAINASLMTSPQEYKLAIYDNNLKKAVYWEEGANRTLFPITTDEKQGYTKIESIGFHYNWMDWKAAGVAIPVFSLRSENSFGIGEFPDLKKLVDWAAITGQKVIQVLPINDTTMTYSWLDSYPYNSISIYALHPIYVGLKEYPLKSKTLQAQYNQTAAELNVLKDVDYDKVLALKLSYLKDLFKQSGEKIMKSKEYLDFYAKNEEWLFPYACFCYLRDKYKTPVISIWKSHNTFDQKKLKRLISGSPATKAETDLTCFTQYLLHKQLVEVKEYAHQQGVILKGDIPIGISRNSVEAWMEPHLFNLDVQTGAPPDNFSFFGQNWGFPTYNWEEMAKDGYQWWIKRFRKMTDYFDAYRIDHILGFFRIWEIPMSSVQGLLGYFSPALPFSADEVRSYGIAFDEDKMLKPYIHEEFLGNLFGIYMVEVREKFLQPTEWQLYELKEEFNTQAKIKEFFSGNSDDKSIHIRDGLYSLCNEVLFVRDKYNPDKFHPRISVQYSYFFKYLDMGTQQAFNRLYDDFFFRRHSQYWREQAMTKLPTLLSSTSMLACGEDLGMIPESVPSVMNELQILSLEIERMPKQNGVLFGNLSALPYLSVCSSSTHDMSPIRLWWKEDRVITQQYYNEVLHREGMAPEECTSDISMQIINNHLHASSMLVILPLQDWLSFDDKLKRPEAEEERINIPAVSNHYWRYRMHLTLEELIGATSYNNQIKSMIVNSGRG